MRHLRLLTLFILACSLASIARAELKVGVGKTIITPDPLLPVSGGVGPGRPAKAKQGELTARALVSFKARPRSRSCSSICWASPRCSANGYTSKYPAFRPTTFSSARRTRTAPGLLRLSRPRRQAVGRPEVHGLCLQSSRRAAINQALDNLQPAQLKIATGEAQGKIAYNYYAPELYDPRMSVIQASRPPARRS